MPKKTRDSTENQIKRLEAKISKLEKEKKKLVSENKTLKDALQLNEEYLEALAEDQSFQEIKHTIENSTSLTKTDKACPNCGNKKMRKQQYDSFYIETCTGKGCNYRNRINEGRPSKA
jgi:regulator of replication initiation timing